MLITVRRVEDRLEERRRSGKHGDVFTCEHVEDGRYIEARERHHRGTAQQAGEDAGLVAEGVEERVDDQVTVTLVQPDDLAPGGEDAQRLCLRRDHRLGPAGRTGREEEVAHRLAVPRGGPPVDLARGYRR